MLPTQAVLLFTAPPLFSPNTTGANLITHLMSAGYEVQQDKVDQGNDLRFRHADLFITICLSANQLKREEFDGSTQSPLSRKSIRTLDHAIDDHRHYLMISMDRLAGTQRTNVLHQLRLAHCITTFFANLTAPMAVHWRASNTLMTNAQYSEFAGQTTPWALFARLETLDFEGTDAKPGITIQNADQFIGAPVNLHANHVSLDTACAAALAFLRHAAGSETPLVDGQTFGPTPGMLFRLKVTEPTPDFPTGQFHLWEANGQPQTVPGDPARSPGATFKSSREVSLKPARAADQLPLLIPAEAEHRNDRLHGLAIGMLMLVIMPPIGAVLLVANSVLGSNGVRTGLIAMVSVAAAIVIGAYTFLNPGESSARTVGHPSAIQVDTITD